MAIKTPASSRTVPGSGSADRSEGNGLQCGEHVKPKGVRTREKILFAAGRHFARRGYSGVRLKDIAQDAGITPAMIVRYFGSKRGLFEAVAHTEHGFAYTAGLTPEERATEMIRYWQDSDRRTTAIALLRSLEFDGGELFQAELRRRVVNPLSDQIRGRDADVRLRLATGIGIGFAMFGMGLLFDPDQAPLPDDDIKRIVPYLAKLMATCLEAPEPGTGTTSEDP